MPLVTKAKVGFFEDDITGPIGFPQTGYMERTRVSEGINDRLFCRTMCLEFDSRKYAIISLDLCGVDRKFREKTCSLINRMTDIPKGNILLSATHTHSAMDGFLLGWNFKVTKFPAVEFYRSKGLAEEEGTSVVRDFIAYKVAGSVYACSRNMVEANLSHNSTELSGVCTNRDDPSVPIDSQLTTIKFEKAEKKPMGCLLNFPCHPTVLSYDNYLYSADFVGYACGLLKSSFGKDFVPLYLNGACAEISTRFTRKRQTFQEAKRLGHILGRKAIFLLKSNGQEEIAEVSSLVKEVQLPLRKLPSRKEALELLDEFKKEYEFLKSQGASPSELRVVWTKVDGVLDVLARIQLGDSDNEITSIFQAIKINNIVIIGVPGELHSHIALMLKEYASKLGKRVVVVGYANDYLGYMLPPEEYRKQNYEAIISQFNDQGAMKMTDSLKLLIKEI